MTPYYQLDIWSGNTSIKTKMMVIDGPNKNRLDIREVAGVEVITHFIYLGSEKDNNER